MLLTRVIGKTKHLVADRYGKRDVFGPRSSTIAHTQRREGSAFTVPRMLGFGSTFQPAAGIARLLRHYTRGDIWHEVYFL
jgi:hypothetical protein